MEKKEYHLLIGKRLKFVLENRNLTQEALVNLCHEKGYTTVNQSAVSKLLSGNNSFSVLLLSQICDSLNLNVSEILSLNKYDETIEEESVKETSNKFITDATDDVFRGYKGKFHVYFYTTKNKEELHHGIMIIDQGSKLHQCMASFSFKTGQLDTDGKEVEKHYYGPVTMSDTLHALYIELRSDQLSEISYIICKYDHLFHQPLESRIATVITICSGIKRLPTMHRMLMTREELSEEDIRFLSGQLRLNNSEVSISENSFAAFLLDKDLPKSFFEYFGENAKLFIESTAKVPHYTFNESLIADSFMPEMDKYKTICLLRKYSTAPRCNKVSAKAEEIAYNYLQLRKQND